MPTSSQIVDVITAISNDFKTIAFGWHVAAATVMLCIAAGWRPAERTLASLLLPPLLSVSAFAWYGENPFNGLVFASLGCGLFVLAVGRPSTGARLAGRLDVVAGALLVAFGWTYPHFLRATSPIAFLYESPFGLIPCPTLALIGGVTLAAGGFSRAWSMVLALAMTIYGVIGVAYLSVAIDVVLVAGAAALWRQAARLRTERIPSPLRDFTHARPSAP